jgi:squalene-hopene/tetraprenyl-beta-curcumene cyclase
MISTDTVFEVLGNPKELDEQSPGEYILEFDVSGIDIKNSVLHLEVRDNVKDSKWLPSKEITVSPVEKGLHWLRTQQNPDGSWQNSVGITSMTALAFLNADYTEDDPTVNKAIQYILDNKNADRSFGRATYDTASEYNLTNRSADRSFGGTYETSTAVWALVATHNPDYNDEIADAKAWLINAQYDEGEGATPTDPCYGGWRYGSSPNDGDLSNTQFALMALDAAYSHLGLEKPKPNDPDGWASKAIKFISRCQNRPTSNDQTWAHDDNQPSYDDGGFIYVPTGWSLAGGTKSYGSMTAAGIWSLRLCGVEVTDARVQAGLNWLANNEDCSFDDNPGHPYGQEHCFLYYYYMSLAKALVMCFEDDLICDDWYTALSIKLPY